MHRFHRTRACAPARAKSRLAASNMNEINKKFSKTNGFMGRGEPRRGRAREAVPFAGPGRRAARRDRHGGASSSVPGACWPGRRWPAVCRRCAAPPSAWMARRIGAACPAGPTCSPCFSGRKRRAEGPRRRRRAAACGSTTAEDQRQRQRARASAARLHLAQRIGPALYHCGPAACRVAPRCAAPRTREQITHTRPLRLKKIFLPRRGRIDAKTARFGTGRFSVLCF